MRAIVVDEAGRGPELRELPVPERGPGHALVRVTAASLNPIDLHIASGHFFDGPPRGPYLPGVEATGVIEDSDTMEPGTRVRVEIVHPGYGRDGTLAEYVVVPEVAEAEDLASQAQVFPVGDDLDDAYLTAIGATGCTAVALMDRVGELGGDLAGAHVLVLAATGSIGSLLVQLARRSGATRVIGGGRDARRLEELGALGVHATVVVGDDLDQLRAELAQACEGRLDIVLEPLWGVPARAALDTLSPHGILLNFGSVAGLDASLSALPLRNKRAIVAGYSGAWTTPAERADTYARLLSVVRSEPLVIDVEEIALDDVAATWPRVQASAGRKYVVRPGAE